MTFMSLTFSGSSLPCGQTTSKIGIDILDDPSTFVS